MSVRGWESASTTLPYENQAHTHAHYSLQLSGWYVIECLHKAHFKRSKCFPLTLVERMYLCSSPICRVLSSRSSSRTCNQLHLLPSSARSSSRCLSWLPLLTVDEGGQNRRTVRPPLRIVPILQRMGRRVYCHRIFNF